MLGLSRVLLTALAISGLPLYAQATFPDKCGSDPLPFAAIQVKHSIDSSCGIKGRPASPKNSQTQNEVKNNFCAGAGGTKPEIMTPQDLVALQAKTHIATGQGKEPADRSALKALGEGKLVRMKAYLFEAHHADLGSGESVNCNGPNAEDNDVHIAFVAQENDLECKSVTAEMSPHYRPDTWTQIGDDEKYDPATKKYTPDPAMEAKLKGHPFRVTGQLFFDASHPVCTCGTTCNPRRSSLWEIHPVYAIEVCKDNATCDTNNDSDWTPFDKWWSGNPAPTKKPIKKRPPHRHPVHEPSPTAAG